VTNRFKGLELIECLKNYGGRFITLYRRRDQNHPQEKELQEVQIVFRKVRGTRDQIANICWSIEKKYSRKTSIFALLTIPKPLIV